MKKIILPMSVIVLAIAGAFASNASRVNDRMLVDRDGYIQGSTCVKANVTCSTTFNPQMCSDGVNWLYDLSGSTCSIDLYHKP